MPVKQVSIGVGSKDVDATQNEYVTAQCTVTVQQPHWLASSSSVALYIAKSISLSFLLLFFIPHRQQTDPLPCSNVAAASQPLPPLPLARLRRRMMIYVCNYRA